MENEVWIILQYEGNPETERPLVVDEAFTSEDLAEQFIGRLVLSNYSGVQLYYRILRLNLNK